MRELVIGAVLLACVVGCSSGSDSPQVTPTEPDATISAKGSSAMKEGRDHDVVATLPGTMQGAEPQYGGVTPDGTVYRDVYVDPDADEPTSIGGHASTGHSDVFLLDPISGKVTEILDGAIRRRPMAVTGMDADDDWVVWLESPDGGFGSGSWTLYSYERDTRKTRKLGSHADEVVVPKAELDYERRPEISGNDVVMATSHWDDQAGRKGQVLSVPLNGSTPMTQVARGATSVDADENGISYFTRDGALRFRDAASGRTRVVDDSDSGCRKLRSGVLSTCDPYGSGTTLRVTSRDGATTAFGPFDGDLGYFYLETGWARFVSGNDDVSTLWAVDTQRMKLFKIGGRQGGWNLMGNDMALVFNSGKRDFTLIKLR